MTPVSSKEFLDIQATIECRFTFTLLCDTIITQSQMHCTDKYSEHSSNIWTVWSVFVKNPEFVRNFCNMMQYDIFCNICALGSMENILLFF